MNQNKRRGGPRIHRECFDFSLAVVILAWLGLAWGSNSLVAQDTVSTSALDVIESTRGGRHWVDLETDPPQTPQQSLASLTIEPGYTISLFAAEPLVRDPVAMTFDARGRMFVAEYSDYPIGPVEGESSLSKIVMLTDSDSDGKADRRTVFADKLDFAHSMMAYRGGMLVGAKSQIVFLQDTDGDDVADRREILFDGFNPAHAQMQIGNPVWAMNNRVYFNYGPGEVYAGGSPDQKTKLPRKDFWFDPLTLDFGSDGGLGQFGNTVDRWGNRFYCTNRNPIMTTFLSPEAIGRNPFHIVATTQYDVARSGGESRVFPLVKMKSNYVSHAGTHTSACGTTAYVGELGDESFSQSVFVCEPIGHLVTRSIVGPEGCKLDSRRAQEGSDFIASTDTWFRPANLMTGPDGALYLADMYRLWVEHPKFLPPEIAARLDWRAGEDRGRIYRIIPQDAKLRSFAAPTSTRETVSLLADPNGWRQTLAQRLLVETQDVEAELSIRPLLKDPKPTTRLRAMWTLDGISRLRLEDVLEAMSDTHPRVRRDAITFSSRWIDRAEIFDAVTHCATDPDVQVRLAVAMAVSGQESKRTTDLLGRLAAVDCSDRSFTDALLTTTKTCSGAIIENLIQSLEFTRSGDANRVYLVQRLASIVGARGDVKELSRLFAMLGSKHQGDWWRAAIVSGIGDGLPRYRGDLGKLTLAKLIANPPSGLTEATNAMESVFEQNRKIATDPQHDINARVAALGVLAFQSFAEAEPTFEMLLNNTQPVELQAASIDAITSNGSSQAAELVLAHWPELGPAVRSAAIEFLLRRSPSTRLTLSAMVEGKLSASVLSVDQRVRLLKHPDSDIRESAIALFGGAVSANRKQVAKKYRSALDLEASATAGAAVFARVCAACHKLGGVGHEAGPSLSDVQNRPKPAILYEILDPNAKVEPRFTAYSVLTTDGQLFHGLIESETSEAIVLKMPEGKTKTIGRAEIERVKVSDVSLMPEGIEKEVTPQQMADLLEYLTNNASSSP